MEEINYDDMSLEDLQKLKEDREKQALINEFKEADALKSEKEKNDYEAKIKADAIEEYKNSLGDPSPVDLNNDTETSKGDSGGVHIGAFSSVIQGTNFQEYNENVFNFKSDGGCDTDISDWSPADVWANVIWFGMYCEADLFKIAVKGIDINKGAGLTVQIRTIGKFSSPSEIAACKCISCQSNTLSTYSLTLKQYGLGTEICEFDIWDAGEAYATSMIKALTKTWGEWFDSMIYSELETATPGYSEVLPAKLSCSNDIKGSCCTNTDANAIYHAIIDLDATMREASYRPDYVIMSPTIAAYFKYKGNHDVMRWMDGNVNVQNGILTKIGHLNVIEYCGANTCTDAANEEIAIVIDSRRAVGAAFGQRPKVESERNIDCNSTTYAMWCYAAFAELDTGAIGHVENPT